MSSDCRLQADRFSEFTQFSARARAGSTRNEYMESVQLAELERLAEEELDALAGRGNKILLRAKLRRFAERSRKRALQTSIQTCH